MTEGKLAPKFAVYRLYDASGALLYVGSSTRAEERIREHRRQREWGSEIARVRLNVFATAADMSSAEQRAIRVESPQHNRMRYADSDRTTRQGVGKTPLRSMRVPDAEWQAWKDAAAVAGMTVTDYVRSAVNNRIKRKAARDA